MQFLEFYDGIKSRAVIDAVDRKIRTDILVQEVLKFSDVLDVIASAVVDKAVDVRFAGAWVRCNSCVICRRV